MCYYYTTPQYLFHFRLHRELEITSRLPVHPPEEQIDIPPPGIPDYITIKSYWRICEQPPVKKSVSHGAVVCICIYRVHQSSLLFLIPLNRMLLRMFNPHACIQVMLQPAAPGISAGTSQLSSHIVGRANSSPSAQQVTINRTIHPTVVIKSSIVTKMLFNPSI